MRSEFCCRAAWFARPAPKQSAAIILRPHQKIAASAAPIMAPTIPRYGSAPGKAGLVVVISEDDLRESVSVGRNRAAADKEPAAEASFGPFNSTTNPVEWRALDGKPFAIIQRWHIADNADQDRDGRPVAKPLLVV